MVFKTAEERELELEREEEEGRVMSLQKEGAEQVQRDEEELRVKAAVEAGILIRDDD